MQLLLRRSQRTGGVMSNTAVFCLDARVEFTADEKQRIVRYKLHAQCIYNSEASKRHLDRAAAHDDRNAVGALKALAFTALAAMNLNITVRSLEQGQHIECKSLDELLGAEEAIMTACQNLRGYLDTAATFDGREVVLDFATDEPTVVALASAPAAMPAVVTATPLAVLSAPPPAALPSSEPRVEPPPFAPTHEMQDGEAVPLARAATVRPAYDPARPNRTRSSSIEPEARMMLMILGAVLVVVLLLQFFTNSR